MYHTGYQAVQSQMTGEPGVFQSTVSQRMGHNLATEQEQIMRSPHEKKKPLHKKSEE